MDCIPQVTAELADIIVSEILEADGKEEDATVK